MTRFQNAITHTFAALVLAGASRAQTFDARDADLAALPTAPEGFEVQLWGKEPLLANPCAMAFDIQGRLFVGMGPQWRGPRPDSPKDKVVILEDRDGDGTAESKKIFAEGFNSVQSIAWRGRDLWVANSPDLTVVRDTDGDDVADEYVKVFTDLGNIEHCLHGLNWGPDGCLYLSKGNSKGISLDGETPKEPGRVAPKAFRELWGYPGPKGAPDLPPPSQVFTRETYPATYQNPADDWGQTGGILRYDPEKPSLTIHSRGYRNPWDIAFDSSFNWLGTDNDQTGGDRVFMPFQNAHFGWGHPWSPAWPGEGHLPTAPNSGQIIEGSYTGIVFADTPHFPESHRGVWFVADWMTKKLYLYRPEWKGALNVPQGGRYEDFVIGGKSLFRPTDIAMGPDGALWALGWGVEYYGIVDAQGNQTNEGRVYRIVAKDRPMVKSQRPGEPHTEWSFDELLADLGSWIPAWQIDARDELVRRGGEGVGPLMAALEKATSQAQETWAAWTLAEIRPSEVKPKSENQTLQFLRAGILPAKDYLNHENPRFRLAALALDQTGQSDLTGLLARETDPVIYHAAWRTLMERSDEPAMRSLVTDRNAGIRRAGVLMLMEKLLITEAEVLPLLQDADDSIRQLATLWLSKVKGIEPGAEKKSGIPDAYPLARNLRTESSHRYLTGTVRKGEPHYTDRAYAIEQFPSFLSGASMIRTPNADDSSSGEAFLSFDSPLNVTVYVAHDERVKAKPAWLTGFGDSDSVITSTDKHSTFRLFAKDFPAGRITLGGNTADGKTGGKGHYFVVLVPKPPTPSGKIATLDEALAALATADPARGEALFLANGGAGCAACHTMNGRGHAFGPDLTGAGDRFDARHLLDSMLNPNAIITEGFAMMSVTMKTGGPQTGVLREQSGLHLTLAQPGGALVKLERKLISKEEMHPVSMMPPFGALLGAQQLADVTAFLLSQKSVPKTGFHLQKHDDHFEVFLDGRRIATYQFRHDKVLRPVWINLVTPGGRQVTRHYPPRVPDDVDPGYKAEADGIIHPHIHTGVWLGFGDLDGHDYWRNTARIEQVVCSEIKASDDSLSFDVLNRFLTTDGQDEVCRQRVRYELARHPNGWSLDLATEFFNDERDFYFGDQEESGLGVRMASPLRVQGGSGRIVNSLGEVNYTGTWGHEAAWWDYRGTLNGKSCGLFARPHTDNPRPCWGHTRDYGVMVLNPFPRQPKERREPYVKTVVKRGETFQLSYTVIVHEGDTKPDELAKTLR